MSFLKDLPGLSQPIRTLRALGDRGDDSPLASSITPNAGDVRGGKSITIAGQNFILDGTGANISVTVGGQPATSVVVVSRTSITCVVPASTELGAADIVVTVGSKSSTLYGAFFYYETVILEVSPIHGPLAGGTSVLITGRNFQLGSSVTFGGIAATDVTWIDGEHIRCTTPAHAVGFVDVVVTEP
jgi:IPT/TIG domain